MILKYNFATDRSLEGAKSDADTTHDVSKREIWPYYVYDLGFVIKEYFPHLKTNFLIVSLLYYVTFTTNISKPLKSFHVKYVFNTSHGLIPDTWHYGLCMRRECRERIPRHSGLAIPTCITASAWRICRDVCRDRYLAVSFDVGGGENVPGIPGACATRNFTYLARSSLRCNFEHSI